MAIMDSTIVNTALPTMQRQFTSGGSIDIVVVAYLVAMAIAIPVSGWVGDRWGPRRIFLISLAGFTVTSAMCALSANLAELVVARILQGAAAGLLSPVGTTLLYGTFPPEERVEVSRILIVPTVIAPAVGPVLGGWLVDALTWHWVFYVNVPVGLLALTFGIIWLQDLPVGRAGRFDWSGFALAGVGFGCFLYALSEGAAIGWASAPILANLLIGAVALVAFVVVELRKSEPMIQPRLLNDRLFRVTNLVSLFSSAGFLGLLFLVPMFLQEAVGVSALTSGLSTFPEAIGVALMTQVAARIYPHVGPRRMMVGSLIEVALVMSGFAFVGLNTSLWVVRLLMFLTGSGMSFIFLCARAASFATIPAEAVGRAAALYNAQNQIGSALGVAVVSSVLVSLGVTGAAAGTSGVPNLTAYHASFLSAAALALIGAVISLAMSDREAAITMRKR
jgi:EmrB/QacA subfamily drug resistance transporter